MAVFIGLLVSPSFAIAAPALESYDLLNFGGDFINGNSKFSIAGGQPAIGSVHSGDKVFDIGNIYTVYSDQEPPIIQISSPAAGAVYVAAKNLINISFAVNDNLDPAPKVTAILTQVEDRGSPRRNRPLRITVANGQSIEPLDIDDGIWRLIVSATDFAGNAAYLAGGIFEVIYKWQSIIHYT